MRNFLFLAMLLVCAVANAEPADPKDSAEAEKTAKSRHAAIAKELKTLGDHEWAGDYYCGDGLGVNVTFIASPKTGYVFECRGCGGLYDRNYGSAKHDSDRIQLEFTFANHQHSFPGIASEFLPVRWGDRHYLIPTNKVVGFCNDVNDGSEPRTDVHGSFLLRRGDEKKRVKGPPPLPAKY